MRRVFILSLAALALTACDSPSAPETTETASGLVLSNYAVRAALGQNPNTGAYVTIKNTGKNDDRLIAVACECSEKAELHSMTMTDDQMQMAKASHGFIIKAGETLELVPAGNHIMLLGLKTRPADGETQDVTLTFEKADPVTVAMPVTMMP